MNIYERAKARSRVDLLGYMARQAQFNTEVLEALIAVAQGEKPKGEDLRSLQNHQVKLIDMMNELIEETSATLEEEDQEEEHDG